MEKRSSAARRRWQRYGSLFWWLLLPLVAYIFYLNRIAHYSIKDAPLPEGTITIPLQPDSSDLVGYIYKPCPFTIEANDSIKYVIDKVESFVYAGKDSCWLEHVLTGQVYIQGKDSLRQGTAEIRDRVRLRSKQ